MLFELASFVPCTIRFRTSQVEGWVFVGLERRGCCQAARGRPDVKVDSKDNHDRTPLPRAAENGHEAVVKLLADKQDSSRLLDLLQFYLTLSIYNVLLYNYIYILILELKLLNIF